MVLLASCQLTPHADVVSMLLSACPAPACIHCRRRRQRRFSDSDGLDDSRGKSIGDRSFGDTLDSSDSWSEGDDGEEGIVAEYRGRWGSGR